MNLIPNGILFTQIMRNNGVDVFVLEPSVGPTQLNGLTFVKMGMADNFPEYAKKYNKRKIKKIRSMVCGRVDERGLEVANWSRVWSSLLADLGGASLSQAKTL